MRLCALSRVALPGLLLVAACQGESPSRPGEDLDASTLDASTNGDGAQTHGDASHAPDAGDGDNSGDDSGTDAALDGSTDKPDIDPAKVVKTSGHQLALRVTPELPGYPMLWAFDLESGDHFDLTPQDTTHPIVYASYVSNNAVLFSAFKQPGYPVDEFMYVAHFTDEGFLPSVQVAGFEGRAATYDIRGWLGGGRYAIFDRRQTQIEYGVDVVDTWTHRLLWHDDDLTAARVAYARVTRDGLWFGYYLGEGAALQYVAQVNGDGVKKLELPSNSSMGIFNASGTRAAYHAQQALDQPAQVYVRELPDGQPTRVATAHSYYLMDERTFADDGVHFFAWTVDTQGANKVLQLFGDAEPAPQSDPTRDLWNATWSIDESEVLISYNDSAGFSLELFDPKGGKARLPVITHPENSSVVVTPLRGGRFVYELNQNEMYVVGRKANGTLLHQKVSEPGEGNFFCHAYYQVPPEGRLLYQDLTGKKLVLVDVSGDSAARVKVLPYAGQFCPRWASDGASFAYTEPTADEKSRLHMVDWANASAPQATFVKEFEESVQVVLARP